MADGFSVNTGELRGFSQALRGLGGHTIDRATAYAKQYFTMPKLDDGVLFHSATSALSGLNQAVAAYLHELDTALLASATELDKQAALYDKTDAAHAAALDATYQSHYSPVCLPLVYGPIAAPDSFFDAAPSADVPENLVSKVLNGDWTGLTGTLATIINMIFDKDPLAEVGRGFSGNWHDVEQASGAAGALHDFLMCEAEHIQTAFGAIRSWSGNAYLDAQAFFTDFASQIESAATELDQATSSLSMVAVGMESAATLAGSFFGKAMDYAMAGAVEMALEPIADTNIFSAIADNAALAVTIGLATDAAKTAIEAVDDVNKYKNTLTVIITVANEFNSTFGTLPRPAGFDSPLVK
ncbi:MAG: hypothetical protein LBM66_02580 [Bifidobacteriaceae bacterium]|jgi:uncharacterized protein YukE|nr:hypothetical protein [Bifidobacteriaceae bacterium]